MTPRLKVLLPSSGTAYPPSRTFPVNSPTPTPLKTADFEGEISVWVKDYHGEEMKGDGHEYFDEEGRKNNTYSIVVRGRYLKPISANDIVFGNVFEKPIKDSLPWGTSIATKFMYFVDPTMELDIYSDKPWALSPLFSTVNYLSLTKPPATSSTTSTTVSESSYEGIKSLSTESPPEWDDITSAGISARRKWLGNRENRESVQLDKDWKVGIEFCNGLLDFNTLSVSLPPPFTLHIPLLKYWDGQPVTYVCRSRDGKTVFWSVGFQIVDTGDGNEEEDEEAEKGAEEKVDKDGKDGKEEVISDDVD